MDTGMGTAGCQPSRRTKERAKRHTGLVSGKRRVFLVLGLLLALVACDREEAMHPGDAPRDAVEEAGHAAADAARASGEAAESLSDAARKAAASDGSEAARQAAQAEAEAKERARQETAEAESEAKAAGKNTEKALEGTEYEQFEHED